MIKMKLRKIVRTSWLLALPFLASGTDPDAAQAKDCIVTVTTTNQGGGPLPVGVIFTCNLLGQTDGTGSANCFVTYTSCTMTVRTRFYSPDPRYTGEICDPSGCSNCGTNCPANNHTYSETCNGTNKPWINLNMHDSQSTPTVIKRTAHQITQCLCIP